MKKLITCMLMCILFSCSSEKEGTETSNFDLKIQKEEIQSMTKSM